MKRLIQKLKKSVQTFIYIIVNIFRILFISGMICFGVTSMLFTSNIIMGIVVGFRYYFMLFGYGSIALAATLLLCNPNQILPKKRKVVKSRVSKNSSNIKKQNRNVPRRKVS